LTSELTDETLGDAFLLGRAMVCTKSRFLLAVFTPLFVCLLTHAQGDPRMGGGVPPVSLNPGQPGGLSIYGHEGSALVLTVNGEKREHLDRQAVVKLTNKSNTNVLWQTTQEGSVAIFTDLRPGIYDIETSAVGYFSQHQDLTVQGINTTHQVEVTLKKDPSAVDLSVQGAKQMPSKLRKDLVRGAAALRSGNVLDAKKHLDDAYKSAPNNSEVNFLLGYWYFEKSNSEQGEVYVQDLDRAESYLANASTLDAHNGQALTLLGRARLQRGDFPSARTTLEQAVAADSGNWMAHFLLGHAYLKLNESELARQQAVLAVEKGRGAGNAAQLVLGEALANLGRSQEAIQALQGFVRSDPTNPSAPQAQQMIADIEHAIAQPTSADSHPPAPGPVPPPATDPVLNAAEPQLSVKSWEPASIDDHRPAVADGVACPYSTVIEQSGLRVKEFVDNLAQFEAIEDLVHQEMDELGNPRKKTYLKFDYVAAVSETDPGRFVVDEFRTGRSGTEDFPDQIATRGLPTLALIFHPDMRDNFEMTCEGLGSWEGKATWLVHFRQREDRPHRVQDYIVENRVYPVSMKGRAWIAADTFQIVRLESELVKPIREIQLLSEHQIVEYASVPFPSKKVELWLPKNADLYFNFRKHRYFRRHSFDHFMLFSVEMEEKRKEPKQKAEQDGPGSKLFHKSKPRKTRA